MGVKSRVLTGTGADDGEEVGFEQGAVDVLGRFQEAIRSLIESIPGRTRRPADLAQTLGIHAKVAWQAHRVAHAADPLAEAGNIPGAAAMKGFLDAASRRGAPETQIVAVRTARKELENLIKRHAGSRNEFDTMVSSLAGEGFEQVDLVQKRAVFKGQSHILGVRAQTHLVCAIYRPSEEHPDRLDAAMIRGMIGLRRFRRDASRIISQTRMCIIEGAARRPVPGEAIDPKGRTEHGVNLLRAFCSKPHPEIRSVPMDLEYMKSIEIAGDGVGNMSAVTCLLGDLYRSASIRYRNEYHQHFVSNVRVRMPCEVLIHDVLIHEDAYVPNCPDLSIFSDHRDVDVVLEQKMEARECDRLPFRESVIYLGKGPEVMATPDVPRYKQMITHSLKRIGWNPDSFKVFRIRIEYPVMPSSVVIHFELPEVPAAPPRHTLRQ